MVNIENEIECQVNFVKILRLHNMLSIVGPKEVCKNFWLAGRMAKQKNCFT